MFFAERQLLDISAVRLIGIRPNETLQIMLDVSKNIQREDCDIHSLCSFHQSILDFSSYIRRPFFQFWVILEPLRNMGINVKIDEIALKAYFAGDQWLETYLDISLPPACSKKV